MVESIVAAAVARIGKEVIHFDFRDYYGGNWGTFPLNRFIEVIKNSHQEVVLAENELELHPRTGLYNFTEFWFISEDTESKTGEGTDSPRKLWPKMKILQSKQFNLDLLPKVSFVKTSQMYFLKNGLC